jgi:leishmanolysin
MCAIKQHRNVSPCHRVSISWVGRLRPIANEFMADNALKIDIRSEMLILLSLTGIRKLRFGDRFCGHRPPMPPMPASISNFSSSRLRPLASWQRIRVVLDVTAFTDGRDKSACHSVGQRVSWSYFTGACTAEQILNASRFSILSQTLKNIESYLSRLLTVHPEVSPISVSRVGDISVTPGQFDADLVIAVAIRPFTAASKVLGVAFPGQTASNGRSIVGGMYLNPEFAPETAEDENSQERFFFTVVFHELMHVLGFSKDLIPSWRDKSTGNRYSNSIMTDYTNDTIGKVFTILHTPAIRRFMLDRFNQSEFAPGIPAGVEIEDGGGAGTEGSHPEARVYAGEVICGIFASRNPAISNLSLSALDDTGWYGVNYSMAEPYPWGDGKSMGIAPLTAFPNQPPQLAFPKHYLCWDRPSQPQCHYTFRSKAYCSPVADFNCDSSSAEDKEACKWRAFVNPLNLPFRGDVPEFDYLYFKVENYTERCDDDRGNAFRKLKGEFFGANSMCAMSSLSNSEIVPGCYEMQCDIGNHLMVKVENQIRYCREENERIEFDGFSGAIFCPKPELICGMKSFLGMKPVLYLPTEHPPATVLPESTLFPEPTEVTEGQPPSSAWPVSTVFPIATAVPASTFSPQLQSSTPRSVLVALIALPFLTVGLLAGVALVIARWIEGRHPSGQENPLEEPHLEIPIPDGG